VCAWFSSPSLISYCIMHDRKKLSPNNKFVNRGENDFLWCGSPGRRAALLLRECGDEHPQ
jgi:hypothetical protein